MLHPAAPPRPPLFDDPKISHPKKRAFLAAFAVAGNLSLAAAAAGVDRRTHTNWLNDDPDYAEAFRHAKEHAGDALVQEATRRAVYGIDKPVFYKGRPIAALKEYSDTLLIFLLKGMRPDVYRERFEHSGPNGGPIETKTIDPSTLSEDTLRRILAETAKP